jgi:hypothetical protein
LFVTDVSGQLIWVPSSRFSKSKKNSGFCVTSKNREDLHFYVINIGNWIHIANMIRIFLCHNGYLILSYDTLRLILMSCAKEYYLRTHK